MRKGAGVSPNSPPVPKAGWGVRLRRLAAQEAGFPADAGESSRHSAGAAARRGIVGIITTRRLVYWLAAMVALLVVGTIVGLIWADTSNLAGAFAGMTNVISVVALVAILIALLVRRRRRLN